MSSTIRDLCSKRIASLEYIERTYQGQVYWFSSVHLSEANIASIIHTALPTPAQRARKAKYYFVLGHGLGNLLDRVASVHTQSDRSASMVDFMKGVYTLFQESDTYASKEPLPVAQVPSFPRSIGQNTGSHPSSSRTKKVSINGLFSKNEDFTLLQIPHFAFAPDFLQSFLVFLDVLVEVYKRLIELLSYPKIQEHGSSSSARTTNTSGIASHGIASTTARATLGPESVSSNGNAQGVPTGECEQQTQDWFNKMDGKVKKMLAALMKELDAAGRAKISKEMDSLLMQLVV